MIKFFRKIRYDLMEKNKTGKYLKYAIGEIVLVMAGILLALQVSNWNENTKFNTIKQNYYQQLLMDLKADKNYAKSIISSLDSSFTKYKNYEETFKEPNLTIQKVVENIKNNNYYTRNLEFKTSTIKTLLNTGDIKLLDPMLRNKLTAYKGNKTQTLNISKNNNNNAENILMNAIMIGANLNLIRRLQNQSELMNIFALENKYPKMILEIEAYLSIKVDGEKTTIHGLNEIISDADIIIESIQEKIEK